MSKRALCMYNNSLFVRYLAKFYKRHKDRLANYLRAGFMPSLMKEVKGEFYHFPIRTAGILLISAILVNAVLSLFLGRQIGPAGWLTRGLLFLAGISAISCKADWPALKANSVILKKLYRTHTA